MPAIIQTVWRNQTILQNFFCGSRETGPGRSATPPVNSALARDRGTAIAPAEPRTRVGGRLDRPALALGVRMGRVPGTPGVHSVSGLATGIRPRGLPARRDFIPPAARSQPRAACAPGLGVRSARVRCTQTVPQIVSRAPEAAYWPCGRCGAMEQSVVSHFELGAYHQTPLSASQHALDGVATQSFGL